tara:strand:- start:1520 stop:1639 length:120 start_codon:yes stop_codon:yes gene_type:complete
MMGAVTDNMKGKTAAVEAEVAKGRSIAAKFRPIRTLKQA